MILDILHRSKIQFPGMSTGHLKRMLDEAVTYCKTRMVGGSSLFTYDQVKERLANLQSYFMISSAMSFFTSTKVPLSKNIYRIYINANYLKTMVTYIMHDISHIHLQFVIAV